MDWEHPKRLVEAQIIYWSDARKDDWADALQQCLTQAKRCRTMQEVIVDLRQRLGRAEHERNPTIAEG
jgi:hypothetical protein